MGCRVHVASGPGCAVIIFTLTPWLNLKYFRSSDRRLLFSRAQEAGADMFVWDVNGNTMFHNAARNGRLWLAAYLLSSRQKCGRENANVAAGNGNDHNVNSIAGECCDSGAYAPHSYGDTACSAAYVKPLFLGESSYCFPERDEKAFEFRNGEFVADKGASTGRGQWQEFVSRDCQRTVDCLLHRVDCDGHTALDWACYSGQTAVAKLFVANGMDPFSTDSGGRNCLHWAASQAR